MFGRKLPCCILGKVGKHVFFHGNLKELLTNHANATVSVGNSRPYKGLLTTIMSSNKALLGSYFLEGWHWVGPLDPDDNGFCWSAVSGAFRSSVNDLSGGCLP